MTEAAPADPTLSEGNPSAGLLTPPSGLVERDQREQIFEPTVESPGALETGAAQRRALVIGEALIDVVRRTDGSVTEHVGGSPANVAIGLGRLGRGVDLLTWCGPDQHGRMIVDHLEASAVAVVPGSETADRTSVASATIDPDGAATYEFDLSWQIPARWTSPAGAPLVVHTGSIAAVLPPGAADVANILAAHRESATLTYDPNLRPSLMPAARQVRPVVEDTVAIADVVKVSDEDLAWLEPGSDPLDIARTWVTAGPALVVVTRGRNGATAVTARGIEVEVPAPVVTVADTVGAGDSFMSGLIDGLWSADLLGAERRESLSQIDERTLRTVLERCVRIAAITVSRPGANPPTTTELD